MKGVEICLHGLGKYAHVKLTQRINMFLVSHVPVCLHWRSRTTMISSALTRPPICTVWESVFRTETELFNGQYVMVHWNKARNNTVDCMKTLTHTKGSCYNIVHKKTTSTRYSRGNPTAFNIASFHTTLTDSLWFDSFNDAISTLEVIQQWITYKHNHAE